MSPLFSLMDIAWCRLCDTQLVPDFEAGMRVYRCPLPCERRSPVDAEVFESIVRDVLNGHAPHLFRRRDHGEPHPAALLARVSVGAAIRQAELRLQWRVSRVVFA
ncbi:hypothetical protein F4553_002319 [Allocatelliglobosispora scoriae]|uniref:Uncharacterized protein n=1 Tax=Allocatelliglobosispora scoriae TaxID=643052 RepID=A0A841BQ39_9ACTN|nr:hypothetical protein [Allocatelliglobosispora scoriae]MBB5868940.1 hypothetical protein [Allocatelliglobosispora scoriae]